MDIVVKSRSSGIVHLNSFWTSEVFSDEYDDLSLVNRNLDLLSEYISAIAHSAEKKVRSRQRISRHFFDED